MNFAICKVRHNGQCLCLHIRGILMPSWQITCNIRSHYPCATLQMFSDLTATGANLHDKPSDYKRFSSAIFWPYMRLWEDHWQMATLTEKQARCVDKLPPLTFLIAAEKCPRPSSPCLPTPAAPLRAFYGINQLPLRAASFVHLLATNPAPTFPFWRQNPNNRKHLTMSWITKIPTMSQKSNIVLKIPKIPPKISSFRLWRKRTEGEELF